ncbi:hypothetical protein OSB04_012312 [Centaurea solstitialis]|uniref:Uncharacterized protein n=1 Tax=Centaurea solstitialis TaxID=347529 RepID=A0AA38TB62_9ASTR|nr:hypothetical protein OSB04_012312 [Centaurea solstitialis]
MVSCNPCSNPADTKTKLVADGEPVSDPILYQSLVVALQYLTFTHPDIAYVVQQVCLFMHDLLLLHFNALRILRYLKGTLSHGLHIKVVIRHEDLTKTQQWYQSHRHEKSHEVKGDRWRNGGTLQPNYATDRRPNHNGGSSRPNCQTVAELPPSRGPINVRSPWPPHQSGGSYD